MGKTGQYDSGTALTDGHQIEEIVQNSEMTLGLHTNNMPYLVDNKEVLTLKANFGTFKKDYFTLQKILKEHFHYYSRYLVYLYGE